MDPSDTARPTDPLAQRVADLESELERVRDEHRVALEHERLRQREHAVGKAAELETARDRNRLLVKRVKRLRERLDDAAGDLRSAGERERALRAELDAVLASRTWRAGRAVARVRRR